MVRDARTDNAVFPADYISYSDAGFAVRVGKKFYLTDGVREDLPIGEFHEDDGARFLRVSETEYSIKVGADRYFLLDAAKWTCRKV